MASQLDNTDYTSIEKIGTESWSKFSMETCQQLMRETDNRNPEFFGLKVTHQEFLSLGELEVIENHLRVILKQYKNANKKKSPQSAWKSVYANLEALTLYLKTKQSWFTAKDQKRVADVFNAFGAAWISTAEKLNALASFSENYLPSVRTVVNTAIAIGTSLNEKAPKKISNWPEKLESVWTGNPMLGEKPKRENHNEDDDGEKKKGKKGKKGEEEEDAKGKKGAKKVEAPHSPYDFEDAIDKLKADRKQIGGNQFDIAVMPENERESLMVARMAA
ncbi:hypothetical protein HDU76_011609 [Blyttiomyces sp. JEL0837]|nr:hypothetical protein HDU76_011609 [Blyttiomyces sp. JEL0837]